MLTIGDQIKKSRRSIGLSQEQVAELMDKAGRGTVSNWETNKNLPTLVELKKLAEILKTTVAYLVGETPQFEEPRENYVLVKKDDLIELQRKALEREEDKNRELKEEMERGKQAGQ